ncbi:hypothetical protein SAMN04488515_3639 [Cognatiyoonia koreensis]|uniref:Uncharacterized protein n=1 Tax=Cognatiyoonia koreensis TaxID=364200 RepID=A0A1I0S2F5_9RHOB|nr:hypothetical protein [Cognatiyoonia koreensis]SEW47619.1 hypothetical protein SAMN04488515_3639 [Cognatiyoonia koreensis]
MVLEYRQEATLAGRLVSFMAVPFMMLIAGALIGVFGLFSREAYDLVASIFGGDMARLKEFLVFLLLLTISVGFSSILIIAGLYVSLVRRDYVVEIHPDRRTVNIYFQRALLWHHSSSSSYRFDEIEAIELRYDDEGNEIRLRLPDRKFALKLLREYSRPVAEKKLSQLKEMGLPAK